MKLNQVIKSEYTGLLFRFVLGYVFIYASIGKIINPFDFSIAIQNYRILPDSLTNFMAIILPWMELYCGLFLILGIFSRVSAGTLSLLTSVDIYGLKWINKEFDHKPGHRLAYVSQIILARKFNHRISLQLSPVYIHKNLVKNEDYLNEIFAVGVGGRLKLTNRISLNTEYCYLLTRDDIENQYDLFSVGFDIETGGHVFQLHLTNSTGFSEKAFISENSGNWSDGDIHFGFNIKRVFSL